MESLGIVCKHETTSEINRLRKQLAVVIKSRDMWKVRHLNFLHKDDYQLYTNSKNVCFLCGGERYTIGLYQSTKMVAVGCEMCVSRWVSYGMKLISNDDTYIIDKIDIVK